jgi:hypothetical protein
MLKLVLSLPTAFIFGTFRHPSSVTKIGSEEPILATASPRGKPEVLHAKGLIP